MCSTLLLCFPPSDYPVTMMCFTWFLRFLLPDYSDVSYLVTPVRSTKLLDRSVCWPGQLQGHVNSALLVLYSSVGLQTKLSLNLLLNIIAFLVFDFATKNLSLYKSTSNMEASKTRRTCARCRRILAPSPELIFNHSSLQEYCLSLRTCKDIPLLAASDMMATFFSPFMNRSFSVQLSISSETFSSEHRDSYLEDKG